MQAFSWAENSNSFLPVFKEAAFSFGSLTYYHCNISLPKKRIELLPSEWLVISIKQSRNIDL